MISSPTARTALEALRDALRLPIDLACPEGTIARELEAAVPAVLVRVLDRALSASSSPPAAGLSDGQEAKPEPSSPVPESRFPPCARKGCGARVGLLAYKEGGSEYCSWLCANVSELPGLCAHDWLLDPARCRYCGKDRPASEVPPAPEATGEGTRSGSPFPCEAAKESQTHWGLCGHPYTLVCSSRYEADRAAALSAARQEGYEAGKAEGREDLQSLSEQSATAVQGLTIGVAELTAISRRRAEIAEAGAEKLCSRLRAVEAERDEARAERDAEGALVVAAQSHIENLNKRVDAAFAAATRTEQAESPQASDLEQVLEMGYNESAPGVAETTRGRGALPS